jgi:hypothetical protein
MDFYFFHESQTYPRKGLSSIPSEISLAYSISSQLKRHCASPAEFRRREKQPWISTKSDVSHFVRLCGRICRNSRIAWAEDALVGLRRGAGPTPGRVPRQGGKQAPLNGAERGLGPLELRFPQTIVRLNSREAVERSRNWDRQQGGRQEFQ